MKNTSGFVRFFYQTCFGRFCLNVVMKLHLDRIAVRFLWSSWSRPFIGWYVRKNGIAVSKKELTSFHSFRELFVRTRPSVPVDPEPDHLISPCDGWLSAFPIDAHSRFHIKHSVYQLKDFLQDELLALNYHNGTCLIFRLCASDYHHYSYIDDGYQGPNHPIPGVLHSVQPAACDQYPVYVLNKRNWCMMKTDHFGPVIQCEIGALVVGGIVNHHENTRFCKGQEKGHFELAGSTIVLLFESGRIQLRPELAEALSRNSEVRVHQGEWIATKERSRKKS